MLRETSIDHYLGTNYVPNDAEIQELKHCLLEQIQRLKAIEDENELLELRLQRLHPERADTRASIAAHLASYSPCAISLSMFSERDFPQNRDPTMCSDEAPTSANRGNSDLAM